MRQRSAIPTMLSPLACILMMSIAGVVGNLRPGCKPNVRDELIKGFCSCVGRVTRKFAVTNGRILPHLCEFVNMTSIGKCNVLKKALRFYGQFLKRYGHIQFLSEDVRKDLKKIKDYIQNINSKMECERCRSARDHVAEKMLEKLKTELHTMEGSSHTKVKEVIFQLYALRNLLLEITNKLPFTGC